MGKIVDRGMMNAYVALMFPSHLCLGIIYLPAAILLDTHCLAPEISVTVSSYYNVTIRTIIVM